MKHYHYEIHGFQKKYIQKETGKKTGLVDYAPIEVLAADEEEAMKKAKSLLKKKYYRVGRVQECHYSTYDHQESREIEVLKLEQQSEMIKAIKGGHS
jgi:hypothetical protein